MNADARTLRLLQESLKNPPSDPLADALRVAASLPDQWRKWPPARRLQYLRYRLDYTQGDLARMAGVAQSLVSRIERGAPALLGTWEKLFRAMGFDLLLLPTSTLSLGEVFDRADKERPRGLYRRAHPRPRFLEDSMHQSFRVQLDTK